MIIQKRVIENDDFDRAWNINRDYVQSITPKSSDDIQVNTSPHGTTFRIVKKSQAGTAVNNIVSLYDENKAYSVGDMIKVDCNASYTHPFQVSSGSSTPPLVPGFFQCVTPVPAYVTGSTSGSVSGSISGSARNIYNLYYPICPTIPTGSITTVSGSLANQTFWLPISPQRLINLSCNDGSTSPEYVASGFLGINFDSTYLPYHP